MSISPSDYFGVFTQTEEHGESHPAEAHHDGEHAGGHHHSDQPLIILFVFVGMLLGGLLREVNKKTKFPYTPMLIIAGIIMGHWRESLGIIGQSTTILSHINPHMLLFIFIPVLIFESGFNCDWYIFKRALFNIILLAGPGVLWGAVLLACCLKWVCGYTWEDDQISWAGALTMGSILSATDPVAVVALLKELGASVRFGHLIEGESLLNDGVAMVFYQVFVEMAKPGAASPSPTGIAVSLVRIAGGGPILGFLMGLIGSLWLRRVIRDDVLTSTITFICCYIVFYLAEFTFFHVSGILAIVVLGLFMSAFGKTKIYPESEHAVHTVWSFAQYGCETLIFLLTGVLIGIQMLEKSTITSSDWVKLFIFYICMILMRFVMVLTFYKLLKTHSYGLTKAEFWVLIWGGLRGALGLTLALMVGVDTELPIRLRELTVFYMSGTATLTLLINGTTCGSLVNYLGMVDDPKIRKKIFNNTLQRLVIATDKKIDDLKSNKYINLAEWNLVQDMTGVKEINAKINEYSGDNRNSVRLSDINRTSVNYQGLDKGEVHSESRLRILRLLKGLFWERYEEGQVGGEATRMLEEACNVCLDSTREDLKIWENVYINFTTKSTINYFFKMKDWPLIGNASKGFITRHLAFIYEVSTTFIICCKEAKEILDEFPIQQEWIKQIYKELNGGILEAEKFVANLSDDYETIIKAIHSKRAAISVLEYHKKFLSEYKHKGYIDDADYETLRKEVDRKIVNVENHTFEWELPNFRQYVIEFPVFSSLSPQSQQILQQNSNKKQKKVFNAGEVIYEEGEQVYSFYVIEKGTVSEKIGKDFSTNLGIGSFLSFGNAANHKGTSLSTCKALNTVTCTIISAETIRSIMENEPKFEEKVFKGSLIYFVQAFEEAAGPLGKLSEDKLQNYTNSSKIITVQPQQTIKLEEGGYLFEGEFSTKQVQEETLQREADQNIQSYTFLEPNVEYINVGRKSSKVLELEESVYNRQSIRQIMDDKEDENTEAQYRQSQIQMSSAYVAPSIQN